MAHQDNDSDAHTSAPGIDLGGFHWQSVDDKLNEPVEHVPKHQFRALEVDSQKVVAPAAAARVAAPKPPPNPPLGTSIFNATQSRSCSGGFASSLS